MRTRRNSNGYEIVMLSSVKELRMLQNRNNARCNRFIPFKPRLLNKIWAFIHGFFGYHATFVMRSLVGTNGMVQTTIPTWEYAQNVFLIIITRQVVTI